MEATLSVNVPKVHTSEARYALCSLCETNIHHSVRKKQSKFCLNSVDKKIFVNIRVIREQITSRGGSYRTQIARIFTDSFFLPHTDHTNRTEAASQGVRAAWRLRRVYTTGRLSVRIMYLCSYVKKESFDKRTGLLPPKTEAYVLMYLCQKRACRQKNRIIRTNDRNPVLMSMRHRIPPTHTCGGSGRGCRAQQSHPGGGDSRDTR